MSASIDPVEMVQKLNPEPTLPIQPLTLLRNQIRNYFLCGVLRASACYEKIYHAALCKESAIKLHETDGVDPVAGSFDLLSSCVATTMLTLLTASPQDGLFKALCFNSLPMGTRPTMNDMNVKPSASLADAFNHAKARATNPEDGITTVLGVAIADKYWFILASSGAAESFCTFGHSFCMGIGPEGVVIWQSFQGEYTFGAYLDRQGDRVISWDEAEEWISAFSEFANEDGGPWTENLNTLYQKCFQVDLVRYARNSLPELPITRQVMPWVHLHVLEDVKGEDIRKFRWE